MATPTLRGTLTPQLQRYTGRYSPTSGFTYDQEFRGLSPEQMQALANVYANAGCEYELTVQYGVATLRTTDTRGNVSIDTWEIGVSRQLISCFKSPRNIANNSTVDMAIMAFAAETGETDLAKAVATLNDPNHTYLKALYSPSTPFVVPTAAVARRLWERFTLFKEDSVFHDLYTLRHTTNVSNRWPYNIADTNKNYIYTPSQFYNEVQSSIYWLFPMPDAFVNVLTSNPAPNGPGALFLNYGHYVWGYLKGGSPRSTAANNTSNIVTTYDQFLWSTDTYATV